jgi:4-amino-4-deoxy-L-arabinose transferase-like glycosyltransferase
MNRLSIRQLLIFMFIFSLGISVCNAQAAGRRGPRNPEKALFSVKSRKVKETKVREPAAVVKAKEAQGKKDYKNYVTDSRKRAYKIQTPEVQARMTQNNKDITNREKAKKRHTSNTSRKAGRKYK